jgi:hypothetical protein
MTSARISMPERALHALEDDGHLGDALEPGNVLPGQRRVDERRDGAGGTLRAVHVVATSALHVRSHVVELRTHVFLTATKLWCVDGDEETLAATLLGVFDDPFGDIAVLVDV